MISLRRQFATLLLVLLSALWLAPRAHAAAGAYEAELPAELSTARDLCALVPCKDVFPGATHFSERKGQPPYVEAYDNDGAQKKLLGYVMLSTDITDTPAYSGKPVVTLIGMDKEGRFVGVKVLKHSEPILLLGIPESALLQFNGQYLGKSVADKIEVGQSRPDENVIGLNAISGATVTVIAQNQVMMASGSAVARQVGGLDAIHAGLRPDDKARIVGEFKASGASVAMAGDGINDAPALAAADVGLAMGTGTDVAIESAGMTLTRGDLSAIVRARRLADATMRNIRQNLFFSFLFNGIGVPVAAGVLYPPFGILMSPMFAGAAMALSSFTVVANALRLNRVKL